MKNRDIIFLTVIFLVSFYVWTLPIQNNSMPFGEPDQSYHFAWGDYASSVDNYVTSSPPYICWRYYARNDKLGPCSQMYTPPPYINIAISQIIGGERIIPVYIMWAIFSFLGAFALYFLVMRLYGSSYALIAAFGAIFSFRWYMVYLWGQEINTFSFIFIPVIVYSTFRLLESYFKKEFSPLYFFITLFLLLCQYLIHLGAMILSLIIMFTMSAVFLIKYRSLYLNKKILICFGAAFILIAVVCLPFLSVYTGYTEYATLSGEKFKDLSRLVKWTPAFDVGFGPQFVEFSTEYTLLALIPLLAGILFVLIKRGDKELVLISWLIGMYLALHMDIIGTSEGRVVRFMLAEPQLLFIFVAIGMMFIPSSIKIGEKKRVYLKYAVVFATCIFFVLTIGAQAKNNLSNAYPEVARITPVQYEASEWINANTPIDAAIYVKGPITYAKIRFFQSLSQRFMSDTKDGFIKTNELIENANKNFSRNDKLLSPDYVLLDYSDLALLQSSPEYKQKIDGMMQYEKEVLANNTPVYNKNNIRLYRLNTKGSDVNQTIEFYTK